MRRKISFVVVGLLLAWVLPMKVEAQGSGLSSYIFSTGVSTAKWKTLTASTNILPEDDDEVTSALYPIGFSFPFGGTSYTHFSVTENGAMRLGAVNSVFPYSSPLSSSNAAKDAPKIVGRGADGYSFSGVNHVYYQTFGDTMLVVDWVLSPYRDEDILMPFQVQLFLSGKILIVYKTATGTPSSFQVGMCIDATDGWVIDESGTTSTHFTNGSSTEVDDWPANGRWYQWRPRNNCSYPTNVVVSGVNSSGYTVTWDAVTGAQGYVLYNNLTEHSVTGTSYTVSGLAGCEGDYTMSVMAVCGTSEGDTSVPYTTIVNLGGTVSYHEDFDSYTGGGVSTDCTWDGISTDYSSRTLPTGWIFPGAYAGNNPSDATSNIWLSQETCSGPDPLTGSVTHMEFKHASPSLKTYAAMPTFGISAASINLEFKYMIENSCVTMYLGIMTDLSSESAAIASYQRLKTLDTRNAWTTVQADLSTLLNADYPANSYRIVFEYANSCSGLGYRGYIDELKIGRETCVSPTGVEFTNVTANSLRVGWSSSAPSSATYTIYLDGVEYATTAAGATYYDITGLTPLSRHSVGVRTNCVACEQNSQTVTINTRTMCDGTVTLPYSENMDAYSYGVSTSTSAPSVYPNNLLPACWTFTGLSSSASTYPQAFFSTANAHQTNSLMFVNSSSSNVSYAALPLVSGVNVEHQRLDFWYRNSATSTASGEITIGTMVDPSDASTFVPLRTLSKVTSWTRIQDTIGLHDPAANARYVAFRYSGGTSSSGWAAIDSVRVTEVQCLPVSGLTTTNVTSTSMRLTWKDHNHGTTTYTITFNGNTYTTAAGATYYDFNGLGKGQACAFTIRTNCSGLSSDERILYTATTCSEGVSLTYNEPFDYYGGSISTGTGAPSGYPSTHTLPNCWDFINLSTSSSTYPQAFLTNSSTYRLSANSLLFKSNSLRPLYAVLPLPTGTVPTNRLELQFQYKQSVTTDNVGVLSYGVIGNTSDTRTFVQLGKLERTTDWTTITVAIGAFDAYKAAFSGTDRPRVAFRYDGGASDGAYTAIENVVLREICFGGLYADSVVPTACMLHWSDFSGGTNTYTISRNGSVIATTAAGAEQYEVTGLMSSTDYTFTVRPNGAGCDELTVQVHTPCAGGSLPYAEDFNVFTTAQGVSTGTGAPTTSGHHYNDYANAMPNCWYLINRSATTSTYPQMFLTSSSTYRVSGNGFLFRSNNYTPAYAVVATNFGVPASKMAFSFQYKVTNATYPKLEYGVMTNPGDPSSFITLGYTKATSWQAVSDTLLNYPDLPARPLYLAFRYTNGSTSTYYGALDDVQITLLPECGVYGLTAVPVSSTSARLTWRNPYNSSYIYTVKQNGVTIGTTAAGDTTYTVTGLSLGTEYTFTVEASCGASASTNFILAGYGCIDPTDLTASYTSAYYGVYANPYATRGVVNNGPSSNSSRHTIHTDINEYDARTNNGLHTVPPGHTKSVRLGNWSTSRQAEALVYSLTVDTLVSDLLILKYAAVLQAAGHTASQQPRFTLEILDEDMVQIDPTCGSVDFIASTSLGWNQVGSGSSAVLWKDWTSIGIDLKAYHGRPVFIRLTTYDCAQGAHYGYAYFTLECQRRNIASTSCGESQLSNTFTAPDGFSYQWYTDTTTAPVSTSRSITVSGTDNHIYYCRLTFVDIPGCTFMTSAYAGTRYPLALFDTVVSTSNCQFDVSFVNHSTITADGINPVGTGEGVESAEWSFPGSTGDATSNQYHATAHYSSPGTYSATLIAKLAGGSCTDTLTKSFTLAGAMPPLLEGPQPHCASTVPDTLVVKRALTTSWGSDTMIVNPQTTTTYNVVATDSNGCTYNLSYTITIQATTLVDTNAVKCDTYTWRGTTYTTSGDYVYQNTNASGCDSNITLHLTINNSNTGDTNATECNTFAWHGTTYTATPTPEPTHVYTNAAGCDSTVTLHLTVTHSNTGDTTAVVTTNFTWYGTTYTETPQVAPTHTFTNAAGCDSVVTLHLTINKSTVGFDTLTVCDSLHWKGRTLNISGDYQFDTLNVAGADSTLFFHLTVIYSTDSTFFDTIVENQLPYIFNGRTYTASVASDTIIIPNAIACDSIMVYNLHVYLNRYATADSTVCDNWLPLVWNGETFTDAGTATATLTAQHGEDSILTMNVHVSPTYTIDDYDTIVENQLPYLWHGLTFTDSDDQTTTLTSRAHCDSTVTMHLYVWHNLTATDDSTVCENHFPVLWNNVIFNDAGVKSATLTAQHGEDSVVTMTLHVQPTYATTEYATICDNQSYPFGGRNYNTEGTYRNPMHTVRHHCDSIATLILSVNPTYRFDFTDDICASQNYQWETFSWTAMQADASGASQTRTFNETYNGTSRHGCDSIRSLRLTVHGLYFNAAQDIFCFGEPYSWRGRTINLNSERDNTEKTTTLRDTLKTNLFHCDSVFQITLTQRAHPVVSLTYDKGCVYRIHLLTDAPYHVITADPTDPNLAGFEYSTSFSTSIEVPTEYTVHADFAETPTCPYTATLRLNPIEPLRAQLSFSPEVLTADNLEYNLYDLGQASHSRRWYIDDILQPDTAWHLIRHADYAHDSIRVELQVFFDGCSDTTRAVIPIRHSAIFVPNVFTPTRPDEQNRQFCIQGQDIVSGELRIYNREGLLVFQTDNYTDCWDGADLPQGVYIWYFSYYIKGQPNANFTETGSVLLLR
ncbi:MAG: fibronectin type III domain-containing protein [Bacteroidales bacterium]|nr:fibronectin type III domain-containing protein [Bacteroidales bacterium]